MIFLSKFSVNKKFRITAFIVFTIFSIFSYLFLILSNNQEKSHSQFFQKFSVGEDDPYSRIRARIYDAGEILLQMKFLVIFLDLSKILQAGCQKEFQIH